MYCEFIKSSTIENFEKALHKISLISNSVLILSCDENNYELENLNTILKKQTLKIIGGIFPKIIYENKTYLKGCIFIGFDDIIDITIIENISSLNEKDFDKHIEEKDISLIYKYKSMFLFVDGLSKNINILIKSLFENFGLSINYIGAGAGSISFQQTPCLFTNEGFLQDCAILGLSKLDSCIEVEHGFNRISEPLNVTMSKGNLLIELDYKPAFEVYKENIEKLTGEIITKDNFFELAKKYPLGLNKLSGEIIVRDLLGLHEDSIVCISEISSNTFVSILEADKINLITAAKKAKQKVSKNYKSDFTLFIDCISRSIFLDKLYQEELDAVYGDENIFVGALTLGEIANNKKHYLELYNNTAVVAQFKEEK